MYINMKAITLALIQELIHRNSESYDDGFRNKVKSLVKACNAILESGI